MNSLVYLLFIFLPLYTSQLMAECSITPVPIAKSLVTQVYENLPYQPGEKTSFEVSWSNIKAGEMTLEVQKPVIRDSRKLQHFSFEVSTGDWFRHIYVGRYSGRTYIRPFDSGVAYFELSEYRDAPFQRSYKEIKWLDFDHPNCKVKERRKVQEKEIVEKSFYLKNGANDSLGIFFALRRLQYKMGRIEKIPVYSSEKNWWLRIIPQRIEKVSVPYGTYQATKVRLFSFLGKDLQQKGKVYAWVAHDHPKRPLLKIDAKIKIGSIQMVLKTLTQQPSL